MENDNNNSTSHTREALVKDISNLRHDVAQVAQDVKEHAGAHVAATKQLVNEKIQAARQAAAERPFVILGVGFVLGYILASRRRK